MLLLAKAEDIAVSLQMTLIWPFKVTKDQTDNTIKFATYHFLYVFHSNYSAISRETLFFSV